MASGNGTFWNSFSLFFHGVIFISFFAGCNFLYSRGFTSFAGDVMEMDVHFVLRNIVSLRKM